MPNKFKTNKALLKRIRITKSGKVKMGSVGQRHRKSRHTPAQNRQFRRPRYAKAGDVGRLSAMLGRRVIAGDAEPKPKKTKEAAAK